MNATLTDEDCYAIFKASQDAWNRLEVTKNSRLFQLGTLYLTLKQECIVDSSIDPIIQAIATLDSQREEQWKQYLALVLAHKEAVDALSSQPQHLL